MDKKNDGNASGTITVCQTLGAVISGSKGSFISALNAKIYNQDEFIDAIRKYIEVNNIGYTDKIDENLSVSQLNEACQGLRTYTSEEVFSDFFKEKIKIGGYANFVVEDE